MFVSLLLNAMKNVQYVQLLYRLNKKTMKFRFVVQADRTKE